MNNLIVFCGPSACGKSTLIGKIIEQYPDFDFIDVFNYIQKYKDETGHIEPAGSLAAHQEMHQDLGKMDKNLILEIGTNREELNMSGINNLKDKFNIKVIFCLLDAETCIQRVLDRTQGDQKRVISPLDLAAKFQRVFPDNHIKLALEFDLPYIEMNMAQSLEERLSIIQQLINS